MHHVNQLFCYTITKDRLLKELTMHEREVAKHEPEMSNFNHLEDLALPCYTCFSILPVGRFSSICLVISVFLGLDSAPVGVASVQPIKRKAFAT
jgi:hypothetical protein